MGIVDVLAAGVGRNAVSDPAGGFVKKSSTPGDMLDQAIGFSVPVSEMVDELSV